MYLDCVRLLLLWLAVASKKSEFVCKQAELLINGRCEYTGRRCALKFGPTGNIGIGVHTLGNGGFSGYVVPYISV